VRIIPLHIAVLAGLLLVADSTIVAGQQATSGADTTSPRTIAPVIVTAQQRDRALDHVGFIQRSQHSVGHYLTAEQISRMSDFKFSDLLRRIPGIRVGIDKYGEDVVTSPRAGGSLLRQVADRGILTEDESDLVLNEERHRIDDWFNRRIGAERKHGLAGVSHAMNFR